MILASLLGDFDSNILPLFFHYSEDMRIHILLTDKTRSDQTHARKIQAGLQRFCEHHDIKIELLLMSYDEDDIESITLLFERIANLLETDERLLLNSSDALATTQAVLQPLLLRQGGKLLAYDRFENTCNIFDGKTMRQELVSPMTIDEHLMLKDIEYTFIDEASILERKETVFEIMREGERFNTFKTVFAQHKPLDGYSDILELLHGVNKDKDQFYITGTLFEEYCYWLIQGLGFDDIKLGTIVTHGHDPDRTFHNEFDLLCIKENHLNIIECKFRNYVDGEEIVYKYDSVIDLLDADGKVMIVAVGGEKSHSKQGRQFRNGTKYRANESNIGIYQEKVLDPVKFRYKVQEFFIRSI